MRTIRINTPITDESISSLKSGDKVLISGTIYTARDAAHKRIIEAMDNNEALPFDIKEQVIYYCGPSPAKDNQVIGAAGPTTSGRMDKYTPRLLEAGLKVMIGKGLRSEEVLNSIKKNNALYLIAIGGAGAFYADTIKKCELIAYPDLGAEAIYKLSVIDFLCYLD